MRHRILVVGGLAAGPSAAAKAKRVNPDAEVMLFERGEHVSYGICEVPYFIGGTTPQLSDLTPFDAAKLERLKGVQVRVAHLVEEIIPTKKKIVVRDMNRDRLNDFSYERLILATGSSARTLDIEGIEARNVFRVKSLTDGIAIKNFIHERKPKKCVIIGGGYIGMEMCEALRENNILVTLLHVDKYPMTGLEDETRKSVLAELGKNGVTFKPEQKINNLEVDRNGFVRFVTANSVSYETDFVIVSIGVEPNTLLAKQARIRMGKNNGIVTDERQTTSVDSIFAAGDCCEIKNLINNKWMYLPLATYASRQGRVAGENAAGGRAFFKGGIRAIAVKVFNLEIAQVGLSGHEAEESGFDTMRCHIQAPSTVPFFPGSNEVNIVAVADKKSRRLLGANVFGGKGSVLRANVLGLAIQNRLTVDELSRLDLIYSPPFSPLWDPVLVLADQLKKRLG